LAAKHLLHCYRLRRSCLLGQHGARPGLRVPRRSGPQMLRFGMARLPVRRGRKIQFGSADIAIRPGQTHLIVLPVVAVCGGPGGLHDARLVMWISSGHLWREPLLLQDAVGRHNYGGAPAGRGINAVAGWCLCTQAQPGGSGVLRGRSALTR